MRPPAVRTGQEMNDELRYQSHARRAISGSSSASQALRAARPRPPSPRSRCRSSASPRSIAASVTPGRSRSYGRSRTGRHRVARLVAGEPGRGGPDHARLEVDDLERAAAHVEQAPDLPDDLLERVPQPRRCLRHPRDPISTRYAWPRTVLGGEVAVPCRSQSALARPNPLSEGQVCGVSTPSSGADGPGSRATSVCESGQVRKEAALSGSRRAQRESPVPEPLEAQALVELFRGRVHGPLHLHWREGAPRRVRPDGPEARRAAAGCAGRRRAGRGCTGARRARLVGTT